MSWRVPLWCWWWLRVLVLVPGMVGTLEFLVMNLWIPGLLLLIPQQERGIRHLHPLEPDSIKSEVDVLFPRVDFPLEGITNQDFSWIVVISGFPLLRIPESPSFSTTSLATQKGRTFQNEKRQMANQQQQQQGPGQGQGQQVNGGFSGGGIGGGAPPMPQNGQPMQVDPFTMDAFDNFYGETIADHIKDDGVLNTVGTAFTEGYVKPLLGKVAALQKENAELKKMQAAGGVGGGGAAAYKQTAIKVAMERGAGEISARKMIEGLIETVEKGTPEEKKQAQSELDSYFQADSRSEVKKGKKRWAGSQQVEQDSAPASNGGANGGGSVNGDSTSAGMGLTHPSQVSADRGAAPPKRGRWAGAAQSSGIIGSHQASMEEGGPRYSIGQFSLSDPVEAAVFEGQRLAGARKMQDFRASFGPGAFGPGS